MIKHGIDLETPLIRSFCRKWKIREMEVFGSILGDDFGPNSDVDFLVSYDGAPQWSLTQILDMEDELASLIGRKVDIVDRRHLDDPDANPYRRSEILRNRERLHVT